MLTDLPACSCIVHGASLSLSTGQAVRPPPRKYTKPGPSSRTTKATVAEAEAEQAMRGAAEFLADAHRTRSAATAPSDAPTPSGLSGGRGAMDDALTWLAAAQVNPMIS
jgi:hypothetical protein